MGKSKLKNKLFFVHILLILASCLLLLGGVLHLSNGRLPRASAQVNIEVSNEIESEYAFGDKFVIPDCSFEKDGQRAVGIESLQYPDGTQTNKKEITLNQSGNYVLKYIASIGEQVYTKEYAFTVYGRLASYENSKTSLEYKLCTDFGASSTGLMVKIANGDSLSFDHVFDMSEISMATKLLEGFVVPTTQGSVDFTKMVFTFTDVEDPSVRLIYHGNFHDDSNAHGLTYFTAAGNGQVQCGLEYVGQLHVGSTLGCMVPHSFMAMDTGLYYGAQPAVPTAPDAKKFCISYDAKTNQAWAGGKIISDLDDSNYYSALWFGFPSGKAKLTISALNYNGATANICFTEILGVDLSAKNYIDEEAPILTIENEYDTMPSAVVGKTYPIPAASAIDQVNGVCDVKVSAWYNYGAEDQKMVDITDGRFRTDHVGVYAIVYEASDYSGNVGREVLWVRSYSSMYVTKLSVAIDAAYETEMELGVLQTLPTVTIKGGSGNHTSSYTLTKGKESCEIVNDTFRLEEEGEWTLTCTAVDYVGNTASAELVLNGVRGEKPIIMREPKFPTAYISGASYELPLLYAYDYSSGNKEEKKCAVTVEYNGVTTEYAGGESFVPVIEPKDGEYAENITIRYTCDGEEILKKEIPVLVVFSRERIPGNTERYRDVINVERYFYTEDDLTFTNKYKLSDVTGLKISANQDMERANMKFVNVQMANSFSLNFLTVPGESQFSRLNVRLVDSADDNVSIKASLVKDEGQTLMVVGDTVLSLALDFDGGIAAPYDIGFKGGQFIVNSTTSVAVSKTENGEAFSGFPSGKVYFEIEIENASANASIFLQKIGSINANNTQDNTGPTVSTTETVVTNAFKDSIYTIQKVFACDILCPNTVAYLTVIAPDGTFVTSIDGVTLNGVDATRDYQINLSAYGDYSFSVVATESNGWKYTNQSYFEYVVTVADGEAPTINFEGVFATELWVGGTLTIPTYTVADNYTPAEEIVVIKTIVNPKGLPIYLYGDDNAIQCSYAGVYQIKIYVYDQLGNLTTFETSVTVK